MKFNNLTHWLVVINDFKVCHLLGTYLDVHDKQDWGA